MTEQLGLNAADVALIVGMVQCGLIAWGIGIMRSSNNSREATNQMLADIGRGIREQSAGLRAAVQGVEKLLERTG